MILMCFSDLFNMITLIFIKIFRYLSILAFPFPEYQNEVKMLKGKSINKLVLNKVLCFESQTETGETGVQ